MDNDKNQAAGGAEDLQDSAPKDDSNKDQKPDKKDDNVPRSAYQKVSDDMHKYKRELSEMKAKLAQEEADRLAKEKNYEQLYKNAEKRAVEAEEKANKRDQYYQQTQKANAVRIAAIELGLKPEAVEDLELIDFDGVDVEITSTGRYLVHGAEEFATRIKNRKPHWFKASKPTGHNPGGGGNNPEGGKLVTPKDVVNAERSWKAGKITKEEYSKVFETYRTQKTKTN